MMCIGHGYDVHAFTPNRPLILAGVKIPHDYGLAGHSDADVVLHAICDALLGAMGEGDIGWHFPDTDPAYKDVDSRFFLRSIYALQRKKALKVGNIDVTIIAQAPKLASYISDMQHNIAEDLQLSLAQINIKATTTEGLGYIGREEGIAVHAVTIVY